VKLLVNGSFDVIVNRGDDGELLSASFVLGARLAIQTSGEEVMKQKHVPVCYNADNDSM
jgi:hypothetical protein